MPLLSLLRRLLERRGGCAVGVVVGCDGKVEQIVQLVLLILLLSVELLLLLLVLLMKLLLLALVLLV